MSIQPGLVEIWLRLRTCYSRMKNIALAAVLVFYGAGCASTPSLVSNSNMIEPIRPYVDQVARSLDKVPTDRKLVLNQIAATITERLGSVNKADLTFICTHNSRRSHMSQIWAQTAADYYGLDRVHAFSGGTEATACNCRTVSAMRRAGFSIVKIDEGGNPQYLVQYSEAHPPVRAYSKLYNAEGNPKQDFIALMTCSQADQKCPVVEGALARYAIHYADPKMCDDTPEETAAYDARCREIAREMFYIMAQVRRRIDARVPMDVGAGR
jgi:arsenate reductase (thioredoxin)